MFFIWRIITIGRKFVFLPGVVWICGLISMSRTRIWLFVKLGCGLKFSYGEVLASCGLSVHKKSKAYLSLSDTCESVILPSSSTFSDRLSSFFPDLEFFFNCEDLHPSWDLAESVDKNMWLIILCFWWSSKRVEMFCLNGLWWVGVCYLIKFVFLYRS